MGPRIARVHFGSGRSGISTGMGPVGFYTSLGRSSRGRSRGGTRSGGPSHSSLVVAQRQANKEAKVREANRLAEQFQAILELHRAPFPPSQPPVAPASEVVDAAAIHRRYEAAELAGLKWYKFAERKAARRRAAEASAAWIPHEAARRAQEREQLQRQLDDRWEAFVANEPTVVLETLEEAFEDNDAPAAAVGMTGSEVAIVVLVPDLSAVPERLPSTTAAGNLSLRKLPKGQRNAIYLHLICGCVLTTAREALATAPGVKSLRIATLRRMESDSYGRPRAECVMATLFTRAALEGIDWQSADAPQVIADAATEALIQLRGAAKNLVPLDLASEPELTALLDLVDLSAMVE